MSTILKSAAMSLLSKTLQTFLSKYISDVDVEGVALPSLYDGISSGWGVRLSNVHLREGVELMQTLPGTIPKKRKRKSVRTKRPSSETTKIPDESRRKRSETPPTVPNVHRQTRRDSRTEKVSEGEAMDNSEQMIKHDVEDDDDSLELQVLTSRSHTDDEDERPSTPVQDSKSLLSCFYSTPRTAKRMIGINRSSFHNQGTINSLDSSIQEDQTADQSEGTFKEDLPPPLPFTEDDNSRLKDEDQIANTQMSEEETKSETVDQSSSLDEEEQEEYEEYDQPMSLRLGHGGRIGTLDVRLVDKDLHIHVEDCFLTIEAIPIPPEDGDPEKEENNEPGDKAQESSAQGENDGAESSAKQEAKKAASKAKNSELPRKTVGERVLADNPLARAISAIPHLFLRDIRVRIILRDEAPQAAASEEAETEEPKSAVDVSEPSSADTVVDLAVEFLSVTSGQDVLSHFKPAEEESYSNTLDDTATVASRPNPKAPMSSIPSFSSMDSAMEQNKYLLRHIRTGRGPEGGIWLRIIPPQQNQTLKPRSFETDLYATWARNRWLTTTEGHFFRCSGIDIRARIYLGTKKEAARYTWFYDDYEDDEDYEEYDENMLDSMLWSVDYVAPGPQLPFPPTNPHMSRGDGGTPVKDRDQVPEAAHHLAGVDPYGDSPADESEGIIYQKDSNGIQSSKISSCFHRVARGMTPGSCKDCQHLPCDTCSLCWDQPRRNEGVTHDNLLDSSLPMPGLVLQFTIREPLELNVERSTLDSIGLLRGLFTKKTDGKGSKGESMEAQGQDPTATKANALDVATPEEATHTTNSSTNPLVGHSSDEGEEDEAWTEAFPQPENVQVIGIHLAKIHCRIHVMRKFPESDQCLFFYYWDVDANCVNLDYQVLSPLRNSSSHGNVSLQDVRFDVGHLSMKEFKGLDCHQLVLLGLRHDEQNRDRCDSSASAVSLEHDDDPKSPWPSTACVLLEVPPPPETLIYQSRHRHGVQLRFVSVSTTSLASPRTAQTSIRSSINLRLGATSIDMPWKKKNELMEVRSEVMDCLFGGSKVQDNPRTDKSDVADGKGDAPPHSEDSSPRNDPSGKSAASSKADMLMRYNIQVDSGGVSIPPLIKVGLPLTRFSGERSPESGMFIETMLHHFQFSFGEQHPSSMLSSGPNYLSLLQLASLPEKVRSRVLMFLDDLEPLEEALEVKKEKNHFMKYRTVNKAIVKVAKKRGLVVDSAFSSTNSRTQDQSTSSNNTNRTANNEKNSVDVKNNDDTTNNNNSRRRTLMTELLQLDNNELEKLFAIHQQQKAT